MSFWPFGLKNYTEFDLSSQYLVTDPNMHPGIILAGIENWGHGHDLQGNFGRLGSEYLEMLALSAQ